MDFPQQAYALRLESEVATHANNVTDASNSTGYEIFQDALEDFKTELSPIQVDEFSRTTLEQVKRRILSIQQNQDQSKSMIGLSRIQLYLQKISGFDDFCIQAKLWGGDSSLLSAWIWGPTLYILKTSVDYARAMDSILSAYHLFGKCVPTINHYQGLIMEKPQVVDCLAFMYLDLLRFHQRVVKLLHGKWWRKTFDSRWRDYQGHLKATLVNFETHSEILSILSEAWQQQRVAGLIFRFNEHIGQSQSNGERIQELLDSMPVFDAIDRRFSDFLTQIHSIKESSGRGSSQAQEASLHTQVWDDIRKQLNDHVIRAGDDRDILKLLLSMFKRLRDNMTKQFTQWEEDRKETQKTDVLRWMASTGMSQERQHEILCNKRASDTGLWVLDNHTISSWMNDENPIASLVWLNGNMGAGKTILTSQIIQLCMEQVDGFQTHFFYCRKYDVQQNNSLAVLKSILWQMARCNDELLPVCNNKRIDGRQEFLDQISVAKTLLEAFCEYDASQFVIIDGLDECEPGERMIIIDFWRAMVDKTTTHNPGKLRVLLISQDIPDIRNTLKDSDIAATLDLHPAHITQDIRTYLDGKAFDIQSRFALNEAQVSNLLNLIYERADGMFLYVSLTVENLLQQPNRACYEDELVRDLPKDLGDTYTKIIERLKNTLHPNSWMVGRTVLVWLAGATRTLKLHELQAALSMQLNAQGMVRIDQRYRLRDDIRAFDLCGPLVRVIQEEDDMRLEFTHSTTRAYVRSGTQDEGLNANAIDCDMTIKCLSYLATDYFSPALDENKRQYYTQKGYYALQDYAASEWSRHLQQLISHTAPMFEGGSIEAVNATNQLIMVLQRFLGFYLKSPAATRFQRARKALYTAITFGLELTRTTVASLSTGPHSGSISTLYGNKLYKCDRALCEYFFEGFATAEERDRHVNRHDRPFHCLVPKCSVAPLGFANKKDCERHVKNYHPEAAEDGSHGFATGKLRASIEDIESRARFSCTFEGCDKKYTRKANLDAHLDTHNGTRRYRCRSCIKAFTRPSDRQRHEKLHINRANLRS
ncbi:hypothetical protein PG993_002332 [Apiospora rasikravindrae]|uniref:C2H2-type domain-containing protein n=1 Tax=Apiospora rasikravindrae TaxID=990691 RepID=A0ABR1TWR0_9PEZI